MLSLKGFLTLQIKPDCSLLFNQDFFPDTAIKLNQTCQAGILNTAKWTGGVMCMLENKPALHAVQYVKCGGDAGAFYNLYTHLLPRDAWSLILLLQRL